MHVSRFSGLRGITILRRRCLKKNSTTSYIMDSKPSYQKYNTIISLTSTVPRSLLPTESKLDSSHWQLRPAIAKLLILLSFWSSTEISQLNHSLLLELALSSYTYIYLFMRWPSRKCPSLTHILVFLQSLQWTLTLYLKPISNSISYETRSVTSSS